MINAQAFDEYYKEVEAQLSKMTAEEFFALFGLSLDELPPKTQYSTECECPLHAEYPLCVEYPLSASSGVTYGDNQLYLDCA